jgi:hypothetical protein
VSSVSRTLVAWLFWFGSCTSQVKPQAISMTDTVSAQLTSASAAPTEHVYCLYGTTVPGNFWISQAVEQLATFSDGHNVAAPTGCPALAVWHNHPVPADSEPRTYLYFTMTDQHTFLTEEEAPLAFVGVRGGMWCGWSRHQVKQAWDLHVVVLGPVTGQCWKPR